VPELCVAGRFLKKIIAAVLAAKVISVTFEFGCGSFVRGFHVKASEVIVVGADVTNLLVGGELGFWWGVRGGASDGAEEQQNEDDQGIFHRNESN